LALHPTSTRALAAALAAVVVASLASTAAAANRSGQDLRGADLRQQDLRGDRFVGTNLVRADLRGADLRGANLRRANLTRADLRGADLTRADLRGARLMRARLTETILARARLRGARLDGARMRGAVLNGASLARVDLSGLDLYGADLSAADLRRADLSGANLRGAGLIDARLNGADTTGAKLDRRTALPPASTARGRSARSAAADDTPPWRFIVTADFLNQDVDYPDPNWDPVLDYVLQSMALENPDFLAVPGDLVNGNWTRGGAGFVERQGVRYWGAWKRRLAAHGLTTVYAALGDHDIGDNPWNRAKRALLPTYRSVFAEQIGTPPGGAPGRAGTTFSIRHKNLQLIAIDPFEQHTPKGPVAVGVTGSQLAWLKRALKTDAPHVTVMGHTPVLAATFQRFTSGLTVPGGGGSFLWDALSAAGTDLYLPGEVHDVSIAVKDGTTQVVTGSLPGVTREINYMVVTVHPDRMELELKAIWADILGLGPAPRPGDLPPVRLTLSRFTQVLGPYTRARMTLGQNGPRPGREGLFAARYRVFR
jgi:uncharacterized protein YjbI with pentapeptide repeats